MIGGSHKSLLVVEDVGQAQVEANIRVSTCM